VDAASSICSRYRLELITDLPAMQTDGLRPPVRPLPELRYRRVRDEESRAAFAHIMSVAFNVPYPISRQIYESESTWTGAMVGYVAFHGDRPVSTTVTVSAGGVEGVYAVGTLPLEQRRGYGEAVMRYALEQAGAAGRRSILQSSAAGFRLYERMGYRTVARYLVFAST
jgi:GNAT superfamily N-acetyltransferase